MGGAFSGTSSIGGQTRNFIARLEVGTGLADSFNPNANNAVRALAQQSDGKIVIGGTFNGASGLGGQTRNRIARLNPTGTLDTAFNPNASGPIFSIVVQADGEIVVGGFFTSIGGATRNRIARLDPATGLADSFNPNADGDVQALAVQGDGKILVSGGFLSIGGAARPHLARLQATTGLADSFNANVSASSYVRCIAVQADGKILVSGDFTSIGGQTRNRIARLNPATGLADSFNPNADNEVFGIAMQADGKILAGGQFQNIGGQTRSLFARLSNDTAALQNLAVSQTAVTWMRGGSSAQFTRVTFEDSTNGVNYNFLGNGTPAGSNWTLTGLNLSTGQNIYIRARGNYRSGYFNGSESTQESVRNIFLVPGTPLQLTTAVSRKTHGAAGDFDIPLPVSGAPGVECRSSGGVQTLVFTFSNNLVSGNASLTSGTGSVFGGPSFSGNTMTVNLTGVADVQQITVTLSNVTDSFGQVLPGAAVSMNVLAGDTNGNKSVNATDVGQTKAQSGIAVTCQLPSRRGRERID